MKIKVNKEKLKIAAQKVIEKVLARREELRKEAIEIILNFPRRYFFFYTIKSNPYSLAEAEEFLNKVRDNDYITLGEMLDDSSLYNKLGCDRRNYSTFCTGAINLANSLIWACDNTAEDVIYLNKEEIEFFSGWGIKL